MMHDLALFVALNIVCRSDYQNTRGSLTGRLLVAQHLLDQLAGANL